MNLLTVALAFVFFAAVAMTINEGLWSNTITLFCVIISGLAGAIGGVPLGVMAMDQAGKGGELAWYFAFAGIWLVFTVTMVILRLLTDRISRVRVRYLPAVEKIMGWIMGVLVASMLEGFAAFTLLIAPIQSGAWDLKAEDVPKVVRMNKNAIPFTAILGQFVKAEGVDHPLLSVND